MNIPEFLETLHGSRIVKANLELGDLYLELDDSRVVVFVGVVAMGAVSAEGVTLQ